MMKLHDFGVSMLDIMNKMLRGRSRRLSGVFFPGSVDRLLTGSEKRGLLASGGLTFEQQAVDNLAVNYGGFSGCIASP